MALKVNICVLETTFVFVCALFLLSAAVQWNILLPTVGVCLLSQLARHWYWSSGKPIAITGHAAVVTGCDTGFGNDIAKRLDSMGVTVFAGCLHRSGPGARALKRNCSRRLHIVAMDVGCEESVQKSLQYVKSHLPRNGLWAIVNNAGFNVMGDVEWLTLDLYHKAMNVNFYGAVRVSKAFLPLIRTNKGRVVNMSSGRGLVSFPGDSPYHVSKHCLETFSDCLRLEMRKFGVSVSVIEPGHYGAATACQDEANFLRYKEEFDEMWNAAGNDVRETYGRHYLDSMLSAQAAGRTGSAMSTEPVIDATVEALTNTRPKTRYLVDGSDRLFDRTLTIARLSPFLPDSVLDFVVSKMMGSDKFPKQREA